MMIYVVIVSNIYILLINLKFCPNVFSQVGNQSSRNLELSDKELLKKSYSFYNTSDHSSYSFECSGSYSSLC